MPPRKLNVLDDPPFTYELRQAGNGDVKPMITPVSQIDLTIQCLVSQSNVLNLERVRHEKAIAALEQRAERQNDLLLKLAARIKSLEVELKAAIARISFDEGIIHQLLNPGEKAEPE